MEPLIKSAMNRVAVKNEMIARRTTKVVVILQHRGVQRRNRMGHARQVPARSITANLSRKAARLGEMPATSWRLWRHERSFLTQPPRDKCFADDLLRQASHEGNHHSIQPSPQPSPGGRGGNRSFPLQGKVGKGAGLPCSSFRKAVVAAMWGLIRGSKGSDQ